jgi:hypothetical protein
MPKLEIGQTVQRKSIETDRWSYPFNIETPEQLHYHQSYQTMNYKYRIVDMI